MTLHSLIELWKKLNSTPFVFWLNTSFVHCKLWILNICWKFLFGCVKTGTCEQMMGHLVLLGVTEPCRFSVTVLPEVSSWCVFHRFGMLSRISHLACGQESARWLAGCLASLNPWRRGEVGKSRGHTHINITWEQPLWEHLLNLHFHDWHMHEHARGSSVVVVPVISSVSLHCFSFLFEFKVSLAVNSVFFLKPKLLSLFVWPQTETF